MSDQPTLLFHDGNSIPQVGLGVWQMERLQWKQDLIARVDARIHAEPVAPPETATVDDEYRRIRISGIYMADADTLTQAVTKLGYRTQHIESLDGPEQAE